MLMEKVLKICMECILERWDIKYLDIPNEERNYVKSKGVKCNKEQKQWHTYKSNKLFIDFPNTVINSL